MKMRPVTGVMAITMCVCTAVLTACGMGTAPQGSHAHRTETKISDSTPQPEPDIPFYQQVDYGRLPQGYNPEDRALPFLDLCNTYFIEIYERHGLEMRAQSPVKSGQYDLPFWSCRLRDPLEGMDDYLIVNGPDEKEFIRDVSQRFLGDADDSWIPGAYYVNFDISGDAVENCQIAVDTPRGRLGMTHEGQYMRGRVREHCQQAKEKLESLYRDQDFLIGIYGEDLPLKHP